MSLDLTVAPIIWPNDFTVFGPKMGENSSFDLQEDVTHKNEFQVAQLPRL